MRQQRPRAPQIACFATQGEGGGDERRILTLLENFQVQGLPFDRQHKFGSFVRLVRQLIRQRPDLVVMEGTGIAGGLALILARVLVGTRYVVSSGDAVGPFLSQRYPLLAPIAGLYERLLCRLAAGFIGWTPYLVGRALTFGTPRAMTAPGFSDAYADAKARGRMRQELGIPDEALVVGIVGSLVWSPRLKYCYGWELVRAAQRCRKSDVYFVIVGGGTGLPELERELARSACRSVILTGRVEPERVIDYLAAMDLGSLPQSVDGVGSFRYTTKISEYLAANLPIVTGQIPLAYDLNTGWIAALPGDRPWDDQYIEALANFIDDLTPQALASLRRAVDSAPRYLFDKTRQIAQVTAFVLDLLGESR